MITWAETKIRGEKALVVEFWCDGCGQPAHFGSAVNLRAALKAAEDGNKDRARELIGGWYCGLVNGEATCVATEIEQGAGLDAKKSAAG